MTTKLAVIQCVDTGPLESLVLMLRAVGYECRIPDAQLRAELRRVCGRDGLVLSVDDLVRGMGYEVPRMGGAPIREVSIADMDRARLYVDVKAHRVHRHIVGRWPNLVGKVLWYRINGGRPEHVVKPGGEDCGDEVDPSCPVLTPNQWYAEPGLWSSDWPYVCWPPFYRVDEYYPVHGRQVSDIPICLIHNAHGWGYGRLFDPLRSLGVRLYGNGSPDGLIPHAKIPTLLSRVLCMVHLKSSDAPGYSLYEALAAACPVVCTRRLIWRCKMQNLLIPGETCLVFDRETHEGLTDEDVAECTREVGEHLERLLDPIENRRLGIAGRERLREVMWSESRAADVDGLKAWLGRHFS